MSGGQKKNFSILGPKLSDSKAQQYYGDKTRQICEQLVDYQIHSFSHQDAFCPLSITLDMDPKRFVTVVLIIWRWSLIIRALF